MKRVLFVIDNLSAGGLQRQTTALITGLDQSRFEPTVLCFYGERAGRTTQFIPVLKDAGIPVHLLDLQQNPVTKVRAWAQMVRLAWKTRADIVHTVSYHANILAGYTRPLIPPNTRLIVSVRAENTRKQIVNQTLSWRLCRAIVVNSPHLKEELVTQAWLKAEKITVIPNGLEMSRFTSKADPDFRREVAGDASLLLLMVVRIVPRKSPQTLVEALAILKQRGDLPEGLKVVIVGEKEHAATQKALETAIQEDGLQAVIEQHGETDQIARFYQAADFSVLPSLYGEGLPNVVIESLAAGCPVILSEAANRAQIIEDGLTGRIFRTGDSVHLADVLQDAFNMSASSRAAMHTACLEKAQEFAMSNMIDKHQAVYESSLAGRR